MARLCYASDMNGKEAWVETGVVHFDGFRHKPEHRLFHGIVSVFEFDGWPYVRVTVNGEDVMTMPAGMEREEFAVWDDKPTEPFFSDGWPRLAELSGNADAKVFDENQFNSEVDKLYQDTMTLFRRNKAETARRAFYLSRTINPSSKNSGRQNGS